jgi:arylsulfatase A-like enzyme
MDKTTPDRMEGSKQPFTSVITGLLIGLGWGLLFGFLDGLPLLLETAPAPDWGCRLQALAYGIAWHAVTLGLFGGGIGLVTALVLTLAKRPAHTLRQTAVGSALAAALVVGVDLAHRFDLFQQREGKPLAWALVFALAVLAGLLVGGLTYGLGRRGRRARGLPWAILGFFVLVMLAPLVRGFYRTFGEGRGIFSPSGSPATPDHPNIVLITVDSLRADHLAVYGHSQGISPHLDALAERGVLFEQALATAPWSRPSIASLLTSLYPAELGISCRPWHYCPVTVDTKRTTMAEVLRTEGYRTGAYLTNPWLTADESMGQGFEQFVGLRPASPHVLERVESEQSLVAAVCTYVQPWCDVFRRGHHSLFDQPPVAGRFGTQQNQWARQFLEQHHQTRFFLWLHYGELHLPHDPDQPFGKVPKGGERMARIELWELGHLSERQLNPGDDQALRAFYDGEVVETDARIGEILAALDDLRLSDRTVVVVTADHGEAFGEHGEFTYGHTLYEELIHVPLIVAGPIVSVPGSRVPTPVSLVDLLPTLAEMAGAPVPAEARGRSLLPALQGLELEVRSVYAEATYRVAEEWKMIRLGEFKLIYRPEEQEWELYDLGSDRAEQKDLRGQNDETAADLLEKLEQWMEDSAQAFKALPRSAPPADLDERMRRFIQSSGY